MDKSELLNRIEHKLIVSCQARKGWAMYGSDIMAAFAQAAAEGGASALRLNGAADIRRAREKTKLPMIGINKIWTEESDIYITPTFDSAREILDTGVEIIALDARLLRRPGDETLDDIVNKIREYRPEVLIMGEVSTCEEGVEAAKRDIDIVSTTMSGYTPESRQQKEPDFLLISELRERVGLPVIAEGRITTPQEAAKAFAAGAHSVVVGTAITRPEVITSRFVQGIEAFWNERQ